MAMARADFAILTEAVLMDGVKKATKFVSEEEVIKVSRRTVKGKIDKRSKSHSIVFTFGAPNFAERIFIKKAKRAGEKFPIKKIQLQYLKGAR